MRILNLTDTYLPRLGGIELHVSDLARRQRSAGHRVQVLTGERLPDLLASQAEEAEVIRLHTGPTGLGAAGRLGRTIADLAPDVVHAHLTVGTPFTWNL